jgi:protein-L-isoaspartate O-methyltransferase
MSPDAGSGRLDPADLSDPRALALARIPARSRVLCPEPPDPALAAALAAMGCTLDEVGDGAGADAEASAYDVILVLGPDGSEDVAPLVPRLRPGGHLVLRVGAGGPPAALVEVDRAGLADDRGAVVVAVTAGAAPPTLPAAELQHRLAAARAAADTLAAARSEVDGQRRAVAELVQRLTRFTAEVRAGVAALDRD